MFNQDFNVREFNYLVRFRDHLMYFDKNNPNKTKNSILSAIDVANHKFTSLTSVSLNKKTIYKFKKVKKDQSNVMDVVSDDFIIRKINHNIKKIYNVKQSDRHKIIKNVKLLLEEGQNVSVFKTDIANFYESIDVQSCLEYFSNNPIISFETKKKLSDFFKLEIINKSPGLPRGISLSATISECIMRKFDRDIRKLDGVFYYARYVDDIIIFSSKKLNVSDVSELLPHGLQLNESKTCYYDLPDKFDINFLGYKFKKCNKKLSIEISDNKIDKIKKRILRSFVEFRKNKNFYLLKKRLLFLSINYPVSFSNCLGENHNGSCIHAGIAYNYSLINNLNSLKSLDKFMFTIILGKNFKKLNNAFSEDQVNMLKKYSFVEGFKRRIIRKFSQSEIVEITKFWN